MSSGRDPMLVRFADNVRRERGARGMTQEALASAAGIHLTHLARIELAQREPGVITVAKLTQALGVSSDCLFDGLDGRS